MTAPAGLDSQQLTGRSATHVQPVELQSNDYCLLHARAGKAASALQKAARAAGLELYVASSFRDFNRQLGIWNGKFNGQRPLLDRAGAVIDRANLYENELIDAILIWSALPGASRHHWGSDFDVMEAG